MNGSEIKGEVVKLGDNGQDLGIVRFVSKLKIKYKERSRVMVLDGDFCQRIEFKNYQVGQIEVKRKKGLMLGVV